MASHLQAQIKLNSFDSFNPVPIIKVFQTCEIACDRMTVHKGISILLVPFVIKTPTKIRLTVPLLLIFRLSGEFKKRSFDIPKISIWPSCPVTSNRRCPYPDWKWLWLRFETIAQILIESFWRVVGKDAAVSALLWWICSETYNVWRPSTFSRL